jgi:hypothetical protein
VLVLAFYGPKLNYPCQTMLEFLDPQTVDPSGLHLRLEPATKQISKCS